ncbi:MAG TPA: TolC family protein [Candidatus Acidoferrales bacterium]|jgi:outer membrane protein TolC|nr:TolC family protein [Candidatus Acidoferrales bacterium]
MRFVFFGAWALALVLFVPHGLFATPQSSTDMLRDAGNPTALNVLIEEAKKNDPAIRVADTAARAATFAAPQMSSRPDPQFTLQQLSVGSPRPFAGYTNSDFAYLGLGISQQFPYPGKLKLRREVADRDADTAKAHADVVVQDEIETLKTTYFHLAYLQQTLGILQQNAALLEQIEQQAAAHYSSGRGNQRDVLKAQLERTKILREISMHHQLVGEDQAVLKRILHRSQDSPDIVPEPLAASFLRYTANELLDKVRGQNPNVHEDAAMVQHNQAAVELAQKEFRPDFEVSYMYENTDRKFRDYYMLSLSVNFPRRKPRRAALAQAQLNVERAQQERDSETQAALAEVQRQYTIVKTSEEQLLIYRDGLLPQAQATVQAGLTAYQSNRADFESVFSSYADVLNLNLEYQQTLLDHETALADIERLTGVTLP